MRWRHDTALLLAATLSLVGCASQGLITAEPGPVWPPAPAAPRIAHQLVIDDAGQLHRPSLLGRIGTMITGERPHALREPVAVAVASDRVLMIADQKRQGVHVIDLASGRARFVGHVDGTFLVSPVGVAVCGSLLAIADSALGEVYLVTPEGRFVRRLEPDDGFGRPTGLAYCTQRALLFVADTTAHRVHVFRLDGQLVQTIGGPGHEPGEFNFPTHLAIDAERRLYVTDSLNFRVQALDERGRYLFELGRHGDATGHFGVPKGVAVDSHGHIYVADSYFCTVQVFDDRGRLLLSLGEPGDARGQFAVPGGLAVDAEGRIYVADAHNHRVQILRYVGDDPDAQAQASTTSR